MAETVGLVLGAVSISGLFTLCVDCINYVQDGLSRNEDLEWARGQLFSFRIRLFAWGKACGFLRDNGYDKRLDNPQWKEHIRVQLKCIARLFLDADKLSGTARPSSPVTTQTALLLNSSNATFIQNGLRSFFRRMREQTATKSGSFVATIRYSLFEKRRLLELLQKIEKSLEALELVTRDLSLFEQQRQYVEIEIESISDKSILSSLASPVSISEMMDTVSEAASRRAALLSGSAISETSSRKVAAPELAPDENSTLFFSATSRLVGNSDTEPTRDQQLAETHVDQTNGEKLAEAFYASFQSQRQAWQESSDQARRDACNFVDDTLFRTLRVPVLSYSLRGDLDPIIRNKELPSPRTELSRRHEEKFNPERLMQSGEAPGEDHPINIDTPQRSLSSAKNPEKEETCLSYPAVLETLTRYTPYVEYAAEIDRRFQAFLHSLPDTSRLSEVFNPLHRGFVILKHQLRLQDEFARLWAGKMDGKEQYFLIQVLSIAVNRNLSRNEDTALELALKMLESEVLRELLETSLGLLINMVLSDRAHILAQQLLREELEANSDKKGGLMQYRQAPTPVSFTLSKEVSPLDETGWDTKLKLLKVIDRRSTLGPPAAGTGRHRRLRKEFYYLKDYHAISARFVEHEFYHMRLSFIGPPQSAFRGGIFHLVWHFPRDYPFSPPIIRFLNRVYHPNIDVFGNICADILTAVKGGYSPSLVIGGLVISIMSLLSDPNPVDALMPEIAAIYLTDRDLYESNVRAYTKKYAGSDQSYPEFGVLPEYYAEETEVDASEEEHGHCKSTEKGKWVPGRPE